MAGDDLTRQAVYQGLLRALGGYKWFYAENKTTGEFVTLGDDHALRQVVTWALDGDPVTVHAHHVWGVGNAPGGDGFAYDYVKDRYVRWDPTAGEWTQETTAKRVINDDAGLGSAGVMP
jgi:hypothetical protein